MEELTAAVDDMSCLGLCGCRGLGGCGVSHLPELGGGDDAVDLVERFE